jgi:hypothetical protein
MPDIQLPDFVTDQKDLVRDPAGRSGHWLYKPTGTVISTGPDFLPEGYTNRGPEDDEDDEDLDEDDLDDDPRVGKRAVMTTGRYKDQRGVVTGICEPGEKHDAHILLDGAGIETGVKESQFRMLTDEEVSEEQSESRPQS